MALDRTEIAARLRDDINRGVYSADTKLPPYRQLATKLGAAPNTVGEAVRILAAEGLVRIKPRGRAVVLAAEDVQSPSGESAALLREELTAVQGELREVRSQLNALDRRVSGLLSQLDE